MKRLQKPPVAEAKTSKKEPLAEGLQVVPVDSAGRRIWRDISDEKVVDIARKFIEERGITGRRELKETEGGLYKVLRKRKLLDEVGFKNKQRSWKSMSDEEIVEFAKKLMREKGITGRGESNKADSGLYDVLLRRGLLDKVGFEEKLRSWKDMSDEEIVEHTRKMMRENKITKKGKLQKFDFSIYSILRKRRLIDEVGFEGRHRKRRSWKGMSDDEIVEFARKLMRKREISSKGELKKTDNGLYGALRKRGLLDEIGFEEKHRSWKDMSDEELVEFARKLMEERGVSSKGELKKTDNGLYLVLRKRRLIDQAFSQREQQRNDRARDAVIDALTKFASPGEKPEVEVA